MIRSLGMQDSSFIVILNELLGEEESLPGCAKICVMKLLLVFNYDLPIENAGFFTAFRMTNQGDLPIEYVGFFTAFRMTNKGDLPIEHVGFFTAFRMTRQG